MTSTPRPNAGRLGLAITALACVALTITSLGPASAAPAASARRGPEPADTSGGLLYRTRRADFTSLREVPGAALTAHIGLNDHGQITGTYIDDDAVPGPDGLSNTGHGFVQDRHGHTLRIDVSGSSITLPNGINNHGTIAGEYVDADYAPEPSGAAPPGSVHGFIRDRHGTITTFEVSFGRLHSVADINNRGQITGGYRDASGRQLGFLRDGQRYRTLDTPGGNIAWGINDRGEVVLPDPQTAGLLPVAT